MNEQIEIEYKILITKQIFDKILKDYPCSSNYTQTNYYFTHPLLRLKKYMLRIREKQGTFEMTLKRPYLGHRLETNVQLSIQEKEEFFQGVEISNEIIDILKQNNIPISDLKQEFSLTTHRYDIELPEGMLSLDENTYLDIKDYELEFEVNNEQVGYAKFLEIIKPYSLEYKINCPSKITRAYNALKRLDS